MRPERPPRRAAIARGVLAGAMALALSGCVAAVTGRTELPRPANADSNIADPRYAALVDHVQRRWTLAQEGAPMQALVMDARQSVLSGQLLPCGQRPGAVLIDLDTDAGVDAALDRGSGWPAALAAMRSLGVQLVWISAVPQDQLADAAAALRTRALDPDGADLVLGTAPDRARKQLVRDHAATRFCVLAVAGDARADADEAYAYLRDPNTPLPVDSLWGQGWFLLPAPLAALGHSPATISPTKEAKNDQP